MLTRRAMMILSGVVTTGFRGFSDNLDKVRDQLPRNVPSPSEGPYDFTEEGDTLDVYELLNLLSPEPVDIPMTQMPISISGKRSWSPSFKQAVTRKRLLEMHRRHRYVRMKRKAIADAARSMGIPVSGVFDTPVSDTPF
jgi:hypothetical protein